MSAESAFPDFNKIVGYAEREQQAAPLTSRLLKAYGELDELLHVELGTDHMDGEQLQVLDFGPGQRNHWTYFGQSWIDGSIYMSVPGVNNRESPVVVVDTNPRGFLDARPIEDINGLIVVTASLEHAAKQLGKQGIRATIKTCN